MKKILSNTLNVILASAGLILMAGESDCSVAMFAMMKLAGLLLLVIAFYRANLFDFQNKK